ncbi:META domain-containing protein [Rheinheimera sp. D18]|uniref:META domain-containing protein n=1 Tax=Rheinheimera sp. D18 TaxID=2545632 RepID=UPI0010493280|nr:META domain-containing protein [Rheinheimera sp. D18]QBL10668.1 META domain-containing protein [Rheinheimera sp. D18]
MSVKYLVPLCLLTVLTACQQAEVPQGQYQQLTAENNEKPFTLQLEESRLSGFTGCNNAMGDYTIDKGELVVSQLASTMMACEPAAMQREQQFSQFLQNRPKVTIDGKILTLSKDDTVYQFSVR